MADLLLLVAVVVPPGAARTRAAAVSGAARLWLRPRRAEPFAACLSLNGADAPTDSLLARLEAGFRGASRYSITTSLTRSLLAAHADLREGNRVLAPEANRFAAAIVAAARANGVYVARTGPTLVASIKAEGVWARSGDPLGMGGADEARELGHPMAPQPISEFFPLEVGDAVLLVPGITVPDVEDHELAAALAFPLDPDAAGRLVGRASGDAAGLVVWHAPADAEASKDERWLIWSAARRPAASSRSAEPVTPPHQPSPARGEGVGPPPLPPPPTGEGGGGGEPPRQAEGRRAARPRLALRRGPVAGLDEPREEGQLPRRIAAAARRLGWPALVVLVSAAAIAGIALLVVRGLAPASGGSDQAVADAWRIMQAALADPDRDVSADLLSEAIAILEPRAGRDEAAGALLADARDARDRVLSIHRVTRVRRFNLPAHEGFRPVGLWKTEEGFFILDLGEQVLYRLNPGGTELTAVLRPGEIHQEQPLGRLVTAAWSPARGVNTEGQLLLADHVRSLVAVSASGRGARRWWPPDGAMWQRIGPAAATYDDLFLLDTGRGEILRYPARLPGAGGAVVADANREPALATAVDLATDGNLYVLLPDGSVRKLAPGGGRLPFSGAVPDLPLAAPIALFAHPDLERVWVLEPRAARVVELSNQGVYLRQYVFVPEMVRNAVGLHVDPRARELRVLTPQDVLLVEMEE